MKSNVGVALLLLVLGSACGDDGASLGDAAAGLCATDAECDDGLTCSGVERCEEGACRPGKPPSCHDEDPCTRDLCLEPVGCDFVPICAPDAGALDARVPDPEPDAGPSDAGGLEPSADASRDAADASLEVPDTGIEACVGPYYVAEGELLATDPSTLARLEGVRCFIGSLSVRGNRIDDLEALRALRVVTGNLYIGALPRLESVRALDGLEHVAGTLQVASIPGTTDMDVFPALRVVGELWLSGVSKVQRLGGLDSLVQASAIRLGSMPNLRWLASSDGGPVAERIEETGELALQDMLKLEAVAGFGALRSLTTLTLDAVGDVDLSDALEHVRDLSVLTLAGTRLSSFSLPRLERAAAIAVSSNPALEVLALDTVSAVETLSLWNNAVITRIELPGVAALRGLSINTHPILSELRFDQLERITENLTLRANPALSACVIEAMGALAPDPAWRSLCCGGATCVVCEACMADEDAGLRGGDDAEP